MCLESVDDGKILLSGGLTTDICIYKIQDGRFFEREVKKDKNSRKVLKLRHINPFP